jgi:signal transduction histidine kinase/ActR/RegA family two-component response regulator
VGRPATSSQHVRRHDVGPEHPGAGQHEHEGWLAGQGEALEAAMNGASLEVSLGILVRTVIRLLGEDARAGFYLANRERTALHHVVGMGAEYAAAVDNFKVGPDSLACGLAVHTGDALFTPDVLQEPRWAQWTWLAQKFDYRACWSLPIHTAATHFAGSMAVYWREPREATARERECLARICQTAAIIVSRQKEAEDRQRAEAALRESRQRLQMELEDATLLQSISAEIIRENDVDALYQKLVDAASAVMRSDFASMQMLFPERGEGGELLLLGSRGFPGEAVQFRKRVRTDSNCTCGIALRTRTRVIDPDIAESRIMAGTPDQAALLANGMRAAQTTPLISRGGQLLGVISTYWRQPHEPAERDLRLLDVLARQAADVIERRQAEEAEWRHAERLRLLWEAATLLLTADDPDAMLQGLFAKLAPHLGVDAYFNYVVNDAGDALQLASCAGIPPETARDIARLEFGQAICGTAALQRQSMVVTHIQQSHDPRADLVRSFGIRAYACHVLIAGPTLLGTLSFASRSKDRFTPDELGCLETICQYVTVAYERLRLLDQLKAADRRKDEFLAMLAHELRNPLAPIRNAVQILRHQGPDEPELRRNRTVIERQVEHLTRLIDDLLDISRITRNRLELRKEPVELKRIIHEAVDASRALVEQRGLELTVALPDAPVLVNGDEVRLGQVFLNLLNNAAKYTEAGGRIRLAVEPQGDAVAVSVKDSGVGVAPADLPHLFETFFQIDRSLEKAQGGLGIGLSLVRKLVELHGGRVEARSEGLGKGAEFIVHLPVMAAPATLRREPAVEAPPGALPAQRLLIVDDNRDSADTLATLLRLVGNEVHVAYDGQAGLEASERLRPDVVLLDLGMPRVNGFDACRRIREKAWGKDVVLISLTGWGQEQDRSRSKEAGFDEHLTKPVDLATLTRALAAQLPRRDRSPGPA